MTDPAPLKAKPWTGFSVLIVSPSPSHPQDHGNRKRIFEVCTTLQRLGAKVHFLHYPGEHDWRNARPADQEAQMRATWDGYDVVAPTVPLHCGAQGADHLIDEWADPAVSGAVAWLCKVQHFDVVLVNYSWMSFCLDAVPSGIYKILDTHDVFSGRRQLLEANQISAEFFHTTQEEEARGLARADLVWAIKDGERDYFKQTLHLPNVLTMLHAEPVRGYWQEPVSTDGWLRAGFIGARNNVNRRNLEAFLNIALPLVYSHMAPVKILIAGSCCEDFKDWHHPNVEIVGRVADVADFYRSVDVVLAPMQFSTGLKIKVGEAFGSGAPVLAHAHAVEGFPTREPLHLLPNFREMALELIKLSFDPAPLEGLAAVSRQICQDVQRDVAVAFAETRRCVATQYAGITLVVAPMAALDKSSALYDHLRVALEALRASAPVALFLKGAPAKPDPDLFARFDQRLSVFVEPALLAQLGQRAAPSWVGMRLRDVLESRDFTTAYILADCTDDIIFSTGSLRTAVVRHDVVTLAGGDAERLVDVLRTSVDTTVIAADAARLQHWRGQHGIVDVLPVAFGRQGVFWHVAQRAGDVTTRQGWVILGSPEDIAVHALLALAEKLAQSAQVVDVSDPAVARALLAAPAAGERDPVRVLAGAALLVDISPANGVADLLVESALRAGTAYVRLRRGAVAAATQFGHRRNAPASLGQLLRTVTRAVSDEAEKAALAEEASFELALRTASNAGWVALTA